MSEYKRYWDEERETMFPAKRRIFILNRLKEQLDYAYNKIPFYRELYDEHRIRPEQIRSLEDFSEKIPVVTKQMLRESQERYPPFGNYLGVELEEVFHIHGTSGTTGKPTLFGISRSDWEYIAEAQALQCWAAGMRPHDIVQIAFPLSLFVGGWGMLCAAERIGAKVLPLGGGETERQVTLIYDVGSTILCCTPSYCLYLLEAARQMGKDPRSSPLRIGIFGGEPGAGIPEIKHFMEDGWGIRAIDFGNVGEVHPCSNMECEARTGMHAYVDVDYTEVVRKDDVHTLVPMGEPGAVIYTHLWRKSQPMIRYWAGDETIMIDDPCPCGRTYPRLPRGIVGRLDDMLIIRGVNVFPSAIEQALRSSAGIGLEFRIYVEKRGPFDEARIEAEHESAAGTGPGMSEHLETVRVDAERKVKAMTGVRIPVTLVKPGTFSRASLKARRVVDQRRT